MLGTTLWLVVAIGLFATVLLDAASAFGRAGSHAAADHAIEAAMHDAVADYQNRLQAALAQTPPAGPNGDRYANAIAAIPNPLARTYPAETDGSSGSTAGSGPTGTDAAGTAATSSGTRFTVAYDVMPTTVTAPSCVSATDASAPNGDAPDAVGWLQCNGLVAESRMSLHVVVRVLDAAGAATLAEREQFVTLRLFGEPPYSAVAGRKDASAADPTTSDALASPAHEGDIAGDTLSGASAAPPGPLASADPLAQPGAPTSTWPAGGTLIHVRYECRDGAGSCANAAPPDPDGDLHANARWSNGNRPAP